MRNVSDNSRIGNVLFNAFHTVVLDISAYLIQPSNTTNAES